MLTSKQLYDEAAAKAAGAFPGLDLRIQAGDPLLSRNLFAAATQLAMLSADAEVSAAEPFAKTRDGTILADAAMRGIVRRATPARARALLSNESAVTVTIDGGRLLSDVQGRPWVAVTSVSVPAGQSGAFELEQYALAEQIHTVVAFKPFYAIQIADAEDGSDLAGLAVSDSAGELEWRDHYINTWPGERVYHVEADDKGLAYVRFGMAGRVGVQPAVGDVITVQVRRSFGDVMIDAQSPFALESLASMAEAQIRISMDALLVAGQSPISLTVLSDLARYPAVYNTADAVFCANFDFAVRQRHYTALRFLSIWNEAAEERVRGPDIRNMNCLFVACLSRPGGEQVLTQDDDAPLDPQEALALTATQQAIKATIARLDDSYRVRFFSPVRAPLALEIWCKVSTSYVRADVAARIREVVLASFGEEAAATRRARGKPLHVQVYDALMQNVPALQAGGRTDLTVTIPAYDDADRPELWRFVTDGLLTVNVDIANIQMPGWN